MAITNTITRSLDNQSAGNAIKAVTLHTLTGTYATGGYAVTVTELGHAKGVDYVTATLVDTSAAAVVAAQYDATNGKIILHTATAELVNATDPASLVLQVVAYGRGN